MRRSAGLEQQHGNLPHVEVDEVLGLVGDVGAEVATHNTVPGGIVPDVNSTLLRKILVRIF